MKPQAPSQSSPQNTLPENDDPFHGAFYLGASYIEPARNRITIDGAVHTLEPKVMDVLCLLADHPGDVIARDRFITEIWQVNYGADESLTRAISIIRKALPVTPSNKSWIETIPKRGYRLRPQLQPTSPMSTPLAESIDASRSRAPAQTLAVALIVLFFVLAFAVTQLRANWDRAQTPSPITVESDETVQLEPRAINGGDEVKDKPITPNSHKTRKLQILAHSTQHISGTGHPSLDALHYN